MRQIDNKVMSPESENVTLPNQTISLREAVKASLRGQAVATTHGKYGNEIGEVTHESVDFKYLNDTSTPDLADYIIHSYTPNAVTEPTPPDNESESKDIEDSKSTEVTEPE